MAENYEITPELRAMWRERLMNDGYTPALLDEPGVLEGLIREEMRAGTDPSAVGTTPPRPGGGSLPDTSYGHMARYVRDEMPGRPRSWAGRSDVGPTTGEGYYAGYRSGQYDWEHQRGQNSGGGFSPGIRTLRRRQGRDQY